MAKRRPSGDGMVRKREDGHWEGRYTTGYDPDTGKRIIKNVLGRTQTETKGKLKAAVEQAQPNSCGSGSFAPSPPWVFHNPLKPKRPIDPNMACC